MAKFSPSVLPPGDRHHRPCPAHSLLEQEVSFLPEPHELLVSTASWQALTGQLTFLLFAEFGYELLLESDEGLIFPALEINAFGSS